MSENEDHGEPQYIDSRPMPIRQPVAALEHIAFGDKNSPEWRALVEKYPELEYPALWYSFLPDTNTAISIYLELERSINWRWGSGNRQHSGSEVGEELMVLGFIKLRLFGALGGFERVQANSTTLNQTNTMKDERRSRLNIK